MHKVWTCWKVRILCRIASPASHPSWLNSLRKPDTLWIIPQTKFWLLPNLHTPVSSMLFHFLLLTVLETWLPSSQTIHQPGWTPGWNGIKSVGLALSRIERKKVSHQQETFSSQCIVRNKSATRTKRRWYSWYTKHLAFWLLTFSK